MTTTPSVELHAVVRPALMHMWAMSRVVVVLPLVPVTEATGTVGGDDAGTGTVGRREDDGRGLLDDLLGASRGIEQPGHDGTELLPRHPTTGAVHPGERQHDVLDRLTGPHAHTQPSGTDLGAHPARHGADDPHDETLAQRGPAFAGTGRAHAQPAGQRLGVGALELEVAGDVQDDLDRRPREVEVGPVEHPHLVDPHVRPQGPQRPRDRSASGGWSRSRREAWAGL